METLTSLFQIDANLSRKQLECKFEEIAQKLFNEYSLKKTVNEVDIIYDFTEIEFYFYNNNLNDKCVHSHSFQEGVFRVHYSGVDITFNSVKNECYGGILIRGVKNTNINSEKDKYTWGPLRVLCELFSGIKLGQPISLSLIKRETSNSPLLWTVRQGVNGNFKESKLCCYNILKSESILNYSAKERFDKKIGDNQQCSIIEIESNE